MWIGGRIVQVDEKMSNSIESRIEVVLQPIKKLFKQVEIYVVITRVWQIISNKRKDTLVPIICENVYSGDTILKDENKAYFNFIKYNFNRGTVCHKYNSVNRLLNVDTQAVESFHNEMKRVIKMRKGFKTIHLGIFSR